uniref:CPXV160 protein n=1 Tax=Strongyloides papillosus TaxID=174720 RepID=A0A0N5B1S3_STREA
MFLSIYTVPNDVFLFKDLLTNTHIIVHSHNFDVRVSGYKQYTDTLGVKELITNIMFCIITKIQLIHRKFPINT